MTEATTLHPKENSPHKTMHLKNQITLSLSQIKYINFYFPFSLRACYWSLFSNTYTQINCKYKIFYSAIKKKNLFSYLLGSSSALTSSKRIDLPNQSSTSSTTFERGGFIVPTASTLAGLAAWIFKMTFDR